jgi:alkylation response protein AidB-like acyl-CoA dehydrogenase
LCDGSLVGVGALTEPGAGSDAFAMQTSVQRDGDAFILKGLKRYISNAPIADLFVVYAMTDSAKGYHGGVTAFMVEKNAPGFKVTRTLPKMGVRTSPFGELTMTDLRLPRDAVLGEVGSGAAIFSAAMDWERVLLMAGHMGTMQRLFERSIKHARTRKQFGQPIGKFQAVSHRLADMKVQIEAARLLVYRAASRLERERSASLDAAIAKLFASETYVQVALDCLRTHGASGYVADNDFERAARDSVGSTIYSGTSDVQRNIIARWLGL